MKSKKISSLLLAFVIAICLWVYVVTTINPEDSQWIYNIPVTFVNEEGLFSDRNLTLTEGRNSTVNLKFRGSRQDLLKLNNTNVTITVDLSKVTDQGEFKLTYDYSLPENVSANDISIDGRSSYYVDVVVDKLAKKDVEIRAVFSGDVAENYIAEAIELDRNMVEISGPNEIISTVKYAQVVLERVNLNKTVSDTLAIVLMDEDGNPVESEEINCDVNEVSVQMQVSMLKEVPLTVQLINGGGASESNAVVNIEPSSITIKGDAEELQGLNSLSLGTINLGSIEESYSQTYNIVIPDNMTNMTATEATATVELFGLKTRTFTVTNFVVENAPEGLSTSIGTVSLQVKVRGPELLMNSISASNIRVAVDLGTLGNTTGQFSVPVDIYVDGFSDVGAMGSYTVLVSLSEQVSGEEVVPVPVENPEPSAAVITGPETDVPEVTPSAAPTSDAP